MGPVGIIVLAVALRKLRLFIKPPKPDFNWPTPPAPVTPADASNPADFADVDQEARAHGYTTGGELVKLATPPSSDPDLAALTLRVRVEAERLAREHLVPKRVPELEAAATTTGVAAQAVADAYVIWVGQVAVEALVRAAKGPPL